MVWPDSRTEIEQGFARDLESAFASVASPDPDEMKIESAVAEAAKPWFDTTAEDALLAILLLLDGQFGPQTMSRMRSMLTPRGLVNIDTAAQLLGRQVAMNSRRMVGRMRSQNFRRDPTGMLDSPGARGGMTPEQFDVIYGRGRAERIAVTETTRLAEIAEKAGVEVLRTSGIAVQRIWKTKDDEKVCEICGPLHDVPEHLWPSSFASGPPAHVRCRCRPEIIGIDSLFS